MNCSVVFPSIHTHTHSHRRYPVYVGCNTNDVCFIKCNFTCCRYDDDVCWKTHYLVYHDENEKRHKGLITKSDIECGITRKLYLQQMLCDGKFI